jgi:uncharacterized protein (TIGR03382 family)
VAGAMLRLFASAALTSTILIAPHLAAADDSCTPARVMVVLDKSSSMQTGTIGGATKWNIAVDGLGQVLDAYDAKAEFGLMTFPRPNQCSPGGLDVTPRLSAKTAIMGALTTPPPTSGNYTPMAQTLEVAASEPSLQSTTGPRHVVLITDGWQYCDPYDPATRFDGTPAVQQLVAQGITTWIVGFGGEVDATALNRMAVAAGTARPGCDPASTDAAAPNNCYFQVDNSTELVTALTAIAGNISAEICDGLDNDCDGQVDEELTRGCSSACGSGVETCQAGTWAGCDAPAPTAETCDGNDNDCDGVVDQGDVCGGDEPPNGETGGVEAGCNCDSGAMPDAGAFAPFAVLGFVLLGRRRRR